MKRAALLGTLVLLALVAGFAAQRPGSDSPTPSVTNRGPRGLAVLATWLSENGRALRPADAPEVKTLVLAAPSSSEYPPEDVAALRAFVEGGGTLVYLVPRLAPQPALNDWLGVRPGPLVPLSDEPGLSDVGGATVQVRALPGVTRLRVLADSSVHVDDAEALGEHGTLWRKSVGAGLVWVAPGADLAENARLELLDNAHFWAGLPGPFAFDERGHEARAAVPANLLATGLQLLFLTALLFWARGVRMGPPRDEVTVSGPSTMDYVRALGRLLRRTGVEDELVGVLHREARELATRRGWPSAALESVLRQRSLLSVSRALAELERTRG